MMKCAPRLAESQFYKLLGTEVASHRRLVSLTTAPPMIVYAKGQVTRTADVIGWNQRKIDAATSETPVEKVQIVQKSQNRRTEVSHFDLPNWVFIASRFLIARSPHSKTISPARASTTVDKTLRVMSTSPSTDVGFRWLRWNDYRSILNLWDSPNRAHAVRIDTAQ